MKTKPKPPEPEVSEDLRTAIIGFEAARRDQKAMQLAIVAGILFRETRDPAEAVRIAGELLEQSREFLAEQEEGE